MYYNFELVMAGAILLTAMLVGGIVLKIKRGREAADGEPAPEGRDAWPKDVQGGPDADADSQT